MLQRRLAPVYCANIRATDFGLKGLPRSFRKPCAANAAEMSRRLNIPPFGFLRVSAFVRLTTSARLGVALAALDLLAGRHALASPHSRQFGDEGRLFKLSDRASHLANQHGGRGVLNEV